MAKKTFNVTTSSIKWEPLSSEIDISDKGEASVTVVGFVNTTNTSAVDALKLVPATLPTSAGGPIGNASDLNGAKITGKKVSGEDGLWRVTGTYKKSLAATADYGGSQQSDNDRAQRRIVVSEEPLLSHPVALAFPAKERVLLSAAIEGRIYANPKYDPGGEDESEFVRDKTDDDGGTESVDFSDSTVSAGGVTASPLDYARMIKAGIITYPKKSVRHVWSTSRNNPAPDSDYRDVGKVVTSPPLAPSLAGGFQWMLSGVVDTTDNGSTWLTEYEYDASGAGGFLKYIIPGGDATFSGS